MQWKSRNAWNSCQGPFKIMIHGSFQLKFNERRYSVMFNSTREKKKGDQEFSQLFFSSFVLCTTSRCFCRREYSDKSATTRRFLHQKRKNSRYLLPWAKSLEFSERYSKSLNSRWNNGKTRVPAWLFYSQSFAKHRLRSTVKILSETVSREIEWGVNETFVS